MTDPADKETIGRLTQEVERLNQHRFVRIHNSPWRLIAYQFMRGLAFGLGSVIGATVLFSLLVWWLSQFEFLPVVGEWMGQLVDQIQKARSGP